MRISIVGLGKLSSPILANPTFVEKTTTLPPSKSCNFRDS